MCCKLVIYQQPVVRFDDGADLSVSSPLPPSLTLIKVFHRRKSWHGYKRVVCGANEFSVVNARR